MSRYLTTYTDINATQHIAPQPWHSTPEAARNAGVQQWRAGGLIETTTGYINTTYITAIDALEIQPTLTTAAA